MKVLLFTVAYPGEAGGVQAVVHRLSDALNRKGHEVRLHFAVGDSALFLQRPGGSLRQRIRRKRALRQARKQIAGFSPAVVHVHFASIETDTLLAWRKHLGYSVAVTCHGSDLLRSSASDAADLTDRLHAADAVSAVTPALVDVLVEQHGLDPDHVQLIPNGIDVDFWKQAERADDGRTFVAVGRLHEVKGFDLLIRAAAMVPEARLTIIGDGLEREALATLAADLEVDVDFPGRLGPVEIRQIMSTATAFALSSRSEGLPLALLEAMAAGLPCVATRVGGVPAVVDGAGILVEPDDVALLADGLRQMLSANRFEMSAEARRVAAGFSAEASEAAYEQMLLSLTR